MSRACKIWFDQAKDLIAHVKGALTEPVRDGVLVQVLYKLALETMCVCTSRARTSTCLPVWICLVWPERGFEHQGHGRHHAQFCVPASRGRQTSV